MTEEQIYKCIKIRKEIDDIQRLLDTFEANKYQECYLNFDTIFSNDLRYNVSNELKNIIVPALEKFIEDQKELLKNIRGE